VTDDVLTLEGLRRRRAEILGVALKRRAHRIAVFGALLVDLWDDLVLPRVVRSAWTPAIRASREMAAFPEENETVASV
jgi:hypothetical protein